MGWVQLQREHPSVPWLWDGQSQLATGTTALGSGMEVQGAQLDVGLVAHASRSPLAFPWLYAGFHNVLSLPPLP